MAAPCWTQPVPGGGGKTDKMVAPLETILLETEENGEKVLQALEHRFPCSLCRRPQNTEEQVYPDGLHLYEESVVKWMNRRRGKQQEEREAMY